MRNSSDNMCTILEKIKGKNAETLLKDYQIALSPPINISKLLDYKIHSNRTYHMAF